MKNLKWFIYISLGVLLIMMASCGGEEKNPTGVAPYIVISAPETVEVGVTNPIPITVSVTPDAANRNVFFKASAGTFMKVDSDASSEEQEKVDVTGKASAIWFSPESPGIVHISASIDALKADAEIKVTPVPYIKFVDMPKWIITGETIQFGIQIPPEWAGSAVEVKASQASLKTLGAVSMGKEEGSSVLPLTDVLGTTNVLLTAPIEPQGIIVTASLFGTVISVSIDVRQKVP